jgi:DNA polymerase-1
VKFEPSLEIVRTEEQFNIMLETLNQTPGVVKVIGADTETTSLDTLVAQVVGHCFATNINGKYYGWYVPVRHVEAADNIAMSVDKVEAILTTKIYENPEYIKVFWNMKYDFSVLKNHDIEVENMRDGMLLMFLRNENERNHKLKDLSVKYIDSHAADEEAEVVQELQRLKRIHGKDNVNYSMLPVDILGPYGAKDPALALKMWLSYNRPISPELSKTEDGLRLDILDHEHAATRVIIDMERDGFPFCTDTCRQLESPISDAASKLLDHIVSLTGVYFNPGSDPQTAAILDQQGFDAFQLSEKTRDPSWGHTQLMLLDNELGECIAAYRNLTKSLNTYVVGLPKHVRSDGRIHCSYNQIGARTGRASTSKPNLQGIPKRLPKYTRIPDYVTEAIRTAFRIRTAFKAPEGYSVLSIDESQFELRALAHYSKDPRLIEAFERDADVHSFAAAMMFGVDYDQFIREYKAGSVERARQRDICKEINFAIIYGAGIKRLRLTLAGHGIHYSWSEVRNFRYRYMDIFAGVKAFIDLVQSTVRRRGYIFNQYGRHKRVPANKAYVGINYLIQGVTADMLKHAMIKIHPIMDGQKSWLAMAVHDELDFMLHDDEHDLVPKIRSCLEDFDWCKVPIKADVTIGPSWGELSEYQAKTGS